MDLTTITPKQLAELLRASGMPEDDVLDLIKRLGDATGYTAQLQAVGLYYLKPQAPDDLDEAVAA